MITWRSGVVVSPGRRWAGAVELRVRLDAPPAEAVDDARSEAVDGGPMDGGPTAHGRSSADRTAGDRLAGEVTALAYPALVGEPVPGERVALNVSALARGLGTGGYALVVARLDSAPADPSPGPGHLVKARYTPLQAMVLGVDEQESEHHDVLRDADSLDGLPVVVADLHSALPAVVAGLRHGAAGRGMRPPRVVYLMTDGGALPAWFSRTAAALREAGWLDATITTGQAFGGDVEAVTVHSGLLAARHVLQADVVVVAQGPGNLGTGTRWGFSGVTAGEAVNATGVLGGRAVAALRVSGADPRERHRGISHHSLTAYGRVALSPADVVLPEFAATGTGEPGVADDGLSGDGLSRHGVSGDGASDGAARGDATPGGSLDLHALQALIERQAAVFDATPHRLVRVEAGPELRHALAATPVRLSTMGRGLDQDPGAFLASAAAGVHAQSLLPLD